MSDTASGNPANPGPGFGAEDLLPARYSTPLSNPRKARRLLNRPGYIRTRYSTLGLVLSIVALSVAISSTIANNMMEELPPHDAPDHHLFTVALVLVAGGILLLLINWFRTACVSAYHQAVAEAVKGKPVTDVWILESVTPERFTRDVHTLLNTLTANQQPARDAAAREQATQTHIRNTVKEHTP